ncbi:MAG: hypothetical protein KBS66_00565 [Eubacterium sp.]|nr:hypothetical protein [Candidatus Colimonas fimequi]
MSWTDRVVEYPNRVKLTAVSGQDNTFNMEAAEGTVYVEGTLLNAENLNNETTNIVNDIVTNVVVESLLWTNPNPSSAFSAQTVSLNLRGYTGVKIKLKRMNNDAVYSMHETGIGERVDVGEIVVSTTGVNWAYSRMATPNSNGIVFGNAGWKYTNVSQAITNDNNYAIPVAIYGIKKL